MERLRIRPKRTFTIRGMEFDKHVFYFVAQLVAFWLMVAGMLIFVWLWYRQHS